MADVLGGAHRGSERAAEHRIQLPRGGQYASRTNTASSYRVAVNTHLVPGVGAHRLEKLTPEHIEKLMVRMQQKGSAPATAHQAFRTLRTALNEATRRGHLTQNPANLAKPPRLVEKEVEPYTVAEVQRILKVASDRRNSARWAIALALGLRQGEALALKWEHVDLERGALRVRRSRLRPKYAHGCEEPCGKKAGYCARRIKMNEDTDDTKSRAGRRVIGLPTEVVALLREHREAQNRERKVAAQLWEERGWVFASPTGRAVNPNTDYHNWKGLLRDAGVHDGRLHDARHTAATVLMLLGVQERAAMDVMGWATTGMTARYQHVTDPMRADIAKRVSRLIWAQNGIRHPSPRSDQTIDSSNASKSVRQRMRKRRL